MREEGNSPLTSVWANPRQTTADVSAVSRAKKLFVPFVDIWLEEPEDDKTANDVSETDHYDEATMGRSRQASGIELD